MFVNKNMSQTALLQKCTKTKAKKRYSLAQKHLTFCGGHDKVWIILQRL
jgi:hypothetical protein